MKTDTVTDPEKADKTPSLQRRGEIAIAIARYEARRKEFTAPATNEEWLRMARKYGVGVDNLCLYMLQIVLPETITAGTNMRIKVTFENGDPCIPSSDVCGKIAFAILQSKGMEVTPRETLDRIQRISRETTISTEELWIFYRKCILDPLLETVEQRCSNPPEDPDTQKP